MRKGKIKALLFIIVFLLVMATAIALLLDMEREKKEVQELGYDPYAATPVPTLAPTVTPMPVSTIMPTPVPPTPVPTPPPTPVPTPTPAPTPTPVPVGQVIGSGSFRSETGVPLNVRAGRTGSIPRELQNVHADGTGFEREQGYLYPHDFPNHWVRQQYLPDALRGTKYYEYGDNKTEQAAKRYWEEIKK